MSSAMADAVDERRMYGLSPLSNDIDTGVILWPPDHDGVEGIHDRMAPLCVEVTDAVMGFE